MKTFLFATTILAGMAANEASANQYGQMDYRQIYYNNYRQGYASQAVAPVQPVVQQPAVVAPQQQMQQIPQQVQQMGQVYGQQPQLPKPMMPAQYQAPQAPAIPAAGYNPAQPMSAPMPSRAPIGVPAGMPGYQGRTADEDSGIASYLPKSTTPYYVGLEFGTSIQDDADLVDSLSSAITTASFDNGLMLSALGGYKLGTARFEIEYAYRDNDAEQGNDGYTTNSFFANYLFDYSLNEDFGLFGGAGAGYIMSELGSNDDAQFGWQGKAGATYGLGGLNIDLGYKYVSTFSDFEFDIDAINKLEAEYTNSNVYLGLRYGL